MSCSIKRISSLQIWETTFLYFPLCLHIRDLIKSLRLRPPWAMNQAWSFYSHFPFLSFLFIIHCLLYVTIPGSVYQSNGLAAPPDRHVRHQGPGVCTWIVHLHWREERVTIVTTDCIQTSFVTNNSMIRAAVIHLRHQTPGVGDFIILLYSFHGSSITSASHTVQDPI